MNKVEPFLKCVDYWPRKIPERYLKKYRALIEEKQILKPHVVYNRQAGSTLVEYKANQPHEWIKERLRGDGE